MKTSVREGVGVAGGRRRRVDEGAGRGGSMLNWLGLQKQATVWLSGCLKTMGDWSGWELVAFHFRLTTVGLVAHEKIAFRSIGVDWTTRGRCENSLPLAVPLGSSHEPSLAPWNHEPSLALRKQPWAKSCPLKPWAKSWREGVLGIFN